MPFGKVQPCRNRLDTAFSGISFLLFCLNVFIALRRWLLSHIPNRARCPFRVMEIAWRLLLCLFQFRFEWLSSPDKTIENPQVMLVEKHHVRHLAGAYLHSSAMAAIKFWVFIYPAFNPIH